MNVTLSVDLLEVLAPTTLASIVNDLEDYYVHHSEHSIELDKVIAKAKEEGRKALPDFDAWCELTGPHTAYTPGDRIILDGAAARDFAESWRGHSG